MTKLFISYRSLDSSKVDTIVSRLRSLKSKDGTPSYEVWQDKDGIRDGQDWWQAIVDAIIDCNVFVYMISHESVKNGNCRAELNYARRRNRPILPLVLDKEFSYNPVTGKNDIDYWADVPQELDDLRTQFLFYEGVSFLHRLEEAITEFGREPQRWRDIPADRPRDPRDTNDATNNTIALYHEACDYAWRLEIPTAERLFQKLVNLNDPDFGEDAHEWILLLREYQSLIRLDESDTTRHKLRQRWEKYLKHFPKSFLAGIFIFDPKGLQSRLNINSEKSTLLPIMKPSGATEHQDAVTTLSSQFKTMVNNVYDLLPEPFRWVEIPDGKVTTDFPDEQGKSSKYSTVKKYAISKYPITNAQFQVFIDAGGYDIREFWVEEGWVHKEEKGWTRPDAWRKGIKSDHPVVGVSWFEAKAFCSWLSSISKDKIDLPSEKQWRRAAQGDTQQKYPWGNLFINTYCNYRSNLYSYSKGKSTTTPVHKYPKAESPFGVADMIGNVWEWSLFLSPVPSNVRSTGSRFSFPQPQPKLRVLFGGSWNNDNPVSLTVYSREYRRDETRKNDHGFRIVRCI